MISVLTASSNTGASCIKRLNVLSPSTSIRACFRSEDKAKASTFSNAQLFHPFDANDVDTLKLALDGSSTAVIVTPLDHARGMTDDADLTINMIKVAQESKVKRVIVIGSWTTQATDGLTILPPRFLPSETYLREVVGDSMEWTVLRGGYFMQNLMPFKGKSDIKWPSALFPPVDCRDIGEAAAALCLVQGNTYPYNHKFIDCSGPELVTYSDIARTLGEVTGQDVSYEEIPIEPFASKLPPMFGELCRYMKEKQGDAIPFETELMEKLLGRKQTSLKQWMTENSEALK